MESDASGKRGLGVKSYFINNDFAEAFSENLKVNKSLHSLALSNNKLSDTTFYQILDNMPPNLMRLDISQNPNLSMKSYKMLTAHLMKVKSKISHLNFEGNEFGDEICSEICKCIIELKTVHVLNMSKCGITDYGANHISELLSEPGI